MYYNKWESECLLCIRNRIVAGYLDIIPALKL
jgi:hypothetical protein